MLYFDDYAIGVFKPVAPELLFVVATFPALNPLLIVFAIVRMTAGRITRNG